MTVAGPRPELDGPDLDGPAYGEHYRAGEDADARFGDDGRFADDPAAPPPPHGVNWPTVLASAGVAAVISAIILSIGVVGLHRASDSAAQPAVVRVVTDGGGADAPAADPAADPSAAAAAAPGETAAAPAPAAGAGGAATRQGAGAAQQAPQGSAGQDSQAQDPPAQGSPAADAAAPAADSADAGAQAADTGEITAWQPSSPLPADYAVTTPNPTIDQLNGIVYSLIAMPSDDAAKARNLEAGAAGTVVPNTVYNLGIFRAPRGWFRLTGPVQPQDGRITVQLHTFSAGMPGVDMPVDFVYQGGNWKLSSSSLCAGVKAVGLPIYCNA